MPDKQTKTTIEKELTTVLQALQFYAGRERLPKLKKLGVTKAQDALKAFSIIVEAINGK